MSRVYDALQRSQGENQGSSPLATPAPASQAADAVEAPVQPAAEAVSAAVPSLSEHMTPPMTYTDVAPSEAPLMEVPAAVEVRPSAAYRTEALRSNAMSSVNVAANWLRVPSERLLRPHPTPEQRLVTIAEPNSPGAEMFRVLSTRLAHMQNKRPLRKLLITSSVGDEGKSVVAVNLAFTLAQRAGERTLLIEADLRKPTAGALLTSTSMKGISEWADGKLALDDALYQVNGIPLWFLSAGKPMEEPLPLLESDRFAEALQTLSAAFDWVILDATPMLPMADSTSLSRLCDGALVVVREGHTRRKVLNKALETIDKSKLLGMVLNEASMLQVGYDRYYQGYGRNGKPSRRDTTQESERANVVTA